MKSNSFLDLTDTKDIFNMVLVFFPIKHQVNFIVICKQLQFLMNQYAQTEVNKFKFKPLSGRSVCEQYYLLYEKYFSYLQAFQAYHQTTKNISSVVSRQIQSHQEKLVQIAVLDPVIAFWLYHNPEIFLMDALQLFPALIAHQESLCLLEKEKSNKNITEEFIINAMKRLRTERFRYFFYCHHALPHYSAYKSSYVYIQNSQYLLYIQLNGIPKEIKIEKYKVFDKSLLSIIDKMSLDSKEEILFLPLGNRFLIELLDNNQVDAHEVDCLNKAISHLSTLSFLTEKITSEGWKQISDLADIKMHAKQSSSPCVIS